jgi:hypothetical protein
VQRVRRTEDREEYDDVDQEEMDIDGVFRGVSKDEASVDMPVIDAPKEEEGAARAARSSSPFANFDDDDFDEVGGMPTQNTPSVRQRPLILSAPEPVNTERQRLSQNSARKKEHGSMDGVSKLQTTDKMTAAKKGNSQKQGSTVKSGSMSAEKAKIRKKKSKGNAIDDLFANF